MVSIESITSFQDLFTVAGSFFGEPIILGIILLILFMVFAIKTNLNGIATTYFAIFYLIGLGGWHSNYTDYSLDGIGDPFPRLFVLLIGLIGVSVGILWIKMAEAR